MASKVNPSERPSKAASTVAKWEYSAFFTLPLIKASKNSNKGAENDGDCRSLTQNASCLVAALLCGLSTSCRLHDGFLLLRHQSKATQGPLVAANELTCPIFISCPLRARNNSGHILLCHKRIPQENTRAMTTVNLP